MFPDDSARDWKEHRELRGPCHATFASRSLAVDVVKFHQMISMVYNMTCCAAEALVRRREPPDWPLEADERARPPDPHLMAGPEKRVGSGARLANEAQCTGGGHSRQAALAYLAGTFNGSSPDPLHNSRAGACLICWLERVGECVR